MPRVAHGLRDFLLPIAGRAMPRPTHEPDDTILIFQPDHLGDILLSQPAVRHLRESHPASRLVAVVGPWSHEIASIAWPVDEIITVPYPGFTRNVKPSPIEPYLQLMEESRRLSAHRARASYVLRPDAWWAAWLASLVAAEVSTSDDRRSRRFATRSVDVRDNEHAALRAMRIAGVDVSDSDTPAVRRLCVPVQHVAVREAQFRLQQSGIDEPYVVIHPGSGASVKEWPAHRWQAVAASLGEEGYRVVLTGSLAEEKMSAQIASAVPGSVSIAGQTTVTVLAEVLRGAAITLGPDCGPLHLAVATGTPTIHLFGPSDPLRYGPWGDPERHHVVSAGWSCPRCGDLSADREPGCGCMLAIHPNDVIAAARAMLSVHEHVN